MLILKARIRNLHLPLSLPGGSHSLFRSSIWLLPGLEISSGKALGLVLALAPAFGMVTDAQDMLGPGFLGLTEL